MNAESLPSTISELLSDRVAQSARAAACFRRSDVHGWVSITWNELWDQVQIASVALRDLGLRKGDRLAILAHTCPQWQVAEFAALLGGAVVVGIDPHASAEQIEYMLQHCGARGLIVENAHKVETISEAVRSQLRFIVTVDEEARPPNGLNWCAWDTLTLPGTAADAPSLSKPGIAPKILNIRRLERPDVHPLGRTKTPCLPWC